MFKLASGKLWLLHLSSVVTSELLLYRSRALWACRKTRCLIDTDLCPCGETQQPTCPTSSNPALLPSWVVVFLSFTLLMMLLLPDWPVMDLNRICKTKKKLSNCYLAFFLLYYLPLIRLGLCVSCLTVHSCSPVICLISYMLQTLNFASLSTALSLCLHAVW